MSPPTTGQEDVSQFPYFCDIFSSYVASGDLQRPGKRLVQQRLAQFGEGGEFAAKEFFKPLVLLPQVVQRSGNLLLVFQRGNMNAKLSICLPLIS